MAKRSVQNASRENAPRKIASRTAIPRPSAGTRPDPGAHDALHPEIEAEIGRHLQAIYRAVLEEPVPDRFRQLLADLEQREGKKRG